MSASSACFAGLQRGDLVLREGRHLGVAPAAASSRAPDEVLQHGAILAPLAR